MGRATPCEPPKEHRSLITSDLKDFAVAKIFMVSGLASDEASATALISV